MSENKHLTEGKGYVVNQWGELCCRIHMCSDCDHEYDTAGTKDEVCGMNMGFIKEILSSVKAQLHNHNRICKDAKDIPFEAKITCPECKKQHKVEMVARFTGLKGAPQALESYSLEAV